METNIREKYVLKLRNREQIILRSKSDNLFYAFNLNKEENSVCWDRYASRDRKHWIRQNYGLSLKEIMRFIESIVMENRRLFRQF